MIRHFTHVFEGVASFKAFLAEPDFVAARAGGQSTLVQVYSAALEEDALQAIVSAVSEHVAEAVVVGASTVGEIADGRMLTYSTVIGISVFESTRLRIAGPRHDP